MNQEKIGKFIAECRKQNNMTQEQLAERLNITAKAISKWETGRGMPDSSIMLNLCDELKISVNELLNGEKVTTKSFDKTIIESIYENEKKSKKISVGIFYPYVFRHIKNVNHLQKNKKKKGAKK